MLSTVARLTTYLAGCASLPFLGGITPKRVILAILGTAVSLTFVLTLHKVNAIAAAIAFRRSVQNARMPSVSVFLLMVCRRAAV